MSDCELMNDTEDISAEELKLIQEQEKLKMKMELIKKKKQEKIKMEQQKIQEKTKNVKDKQKALIEKVDNKIKNLREVEKAFGMKKRLENKAVKKALANWYKNGIIPYNIYQKMERSKNIFKENCIKFIDLLIKIKGSDNLGIVNSNKITNKPYIKTKYGVFEGEEAKVYLKYIIQNECLEPIKQYYGVLFNAGDANKILEKEYSNMDDCYKSLSFFQLFQKTCQDYIYNHLMKIYYDAEFGNTLQKLSTYKEYKFTTPMSKNVKLLCIRKDCKEIVDIPVESEDEFDCSDVSDVESDYESGYDDDTDSYE